MRILLIEDDFMIGEAIKQILVNHNFIVNCFWLCQLLFRRSDQQNHQN